MNFTEYKKLLKQDALKPVSLFYGEEDFLLDYCISLVRKKTVSEEQAFFNDETYTAENFSPAAFSDSLASFPVFAEKKLIVLNDVRIFKLPSHEQETLAKLLTEAPAHAVILIREQEAPDKRLKLYKAIQKAGQEVEFTYMSPADLKAQITKKLSASGLTIADADAMYIIDLAGPSLTNLHTRIEKLISYMGNRKKVTAADIDAVIEKPLNNKVFDMIDALMDKKPATAFAILTDLKQLKEEPVKLISLIGGQFCDVTKAACLLADGVGNPAAALGGNPWAANKKVAVARKVPLEKLSRGVHLARMADEAVKRDGRDGWDALWELVLSLSA